MQDICPVQARRVGLCVNWLHPALLVDPTPCQAPRYQCLWVTSVGDLAEDRPLCHDVWETVLWEDLFSAQCYLYACLAQLCPLALPPSVRGFGRDPGGLWVRTWPAIC